MLHPPGTIYRNARRSCQHAMVAWVLYSVIPAPIACGSHDHYSLGSRQAGMANVAVMFHDLWSVHHNQAGLAFLDKPTLGFHHENKFIVPQYALEAIAFALPTRHGTLAININYFGYSQYNETKAGLAFGKLLGARVAAGVQVDYLNTYIGEEYGNQGTVSCEAGLMVTPVEHLFIGAHVFNPVRAHLKAYPDEPIPVILRLGMGYLIRERIYLGAEAEKKLSHHPNYRAGLEFRFMQNLYFRSGISTSPSTQAFGLGYSLKGIRGDVAFTHHPVLGFTPHFSILIAF